MLGGEYIAVAVVLRLVAGLSYVVATWRGIVRPNPVSWLFWGLTPLVAFAAQLQDGVAPQAWVTLALGTSPLLVFVVSMGRQTHWRVGRFDALCGGSAAVGVVLWQVTDDPALALLFSILADMLAAVPTLMKAYSAPHTERSFPYFITMSSMTVALLTIDDWEFIECTFLLYILLIDTTIFSVVLIRSAQLGGRSREKVVTLLRESPAEVPAWPAPARAYAPVPPHGRRGRRRVDALDSTGPPIPAGNASADDHARHAVRRAPCAVQAHRGTPHVDRTNWHWQAAPVFAASGLAAGSRW